MSKKAITITLMLSLMLLSGCSMLVSATNRDGIKQIAAGNEYGLFLKNNGKVYAIGKNTFGQLGVGDCVDRYNLTKVRLPQPVDSISVCDDISYALTKDGILYGWGDNRYKQVADTHKVKIAVPSRIPMPEKVKFCAPGVSCTYAGGRSGRLYSWGEKGANFTPYLWGAPNEYEFKPYLQEPDLPVLNSKTEEHYVLHTASMVSVRDLTVGVADDGTVFFRAIPNYVIHYSPGEIVKTAVGIGEFFVLLNKEGNLYLWGSNNHGELGQGNLRALNTPHLLSFKQDPLRDIAVEANHILAVSRSGRLWAWGDNSSHQLGLRQAKDYLVPTEVKMPERIVAVSTGLTHSYAVGESGQIYGFGSNRYGQLLTGSQAEQNTPTRINLSACLANPQKVIIPRLQDERIADIHMGKFLTTSGNLFAVGKGFLLGTLVVKWQTRNLPPILTCRKKYIRYTKTNTVLPP